MTRAPFLSVWVGNVSFIYPIVLSRPTTRPLRPNPERWRWRDRRLVVTVDGGPGNVVGSETSLYVDHLPIHYSRDQTHLSSERGLPFSTHTRPRGGGSRD